MKNRRYLVITVAPLLVLAACTAIAGLDGEYGVVDGGTGTTPEAGSTTSSTSSSSSGSIDGSPQPDGSSSGKPDGSPPETGLIDSGPPPFDATLPTVQTEIMLCPAPADQMTAGMRFCWDFERAFDLTQPNYSWQEIRRAGGMLDVPDGSGVPRRVRASVTGQQPNREAVIVWHDWGNSGNAPLAVKPGQELDLGFTLTIGLANAYGVVGGLELGGKTFGLAIYPKSCRGGVDCLAANAQAGAFDLTNASSFERDKRYRVHVIATRPLDGAASWSGKITIGGRTVEDRASGIFPNGAASGTPARLDFGVFAATGAGETRVDIDDIQLIMTPTPFPVEP